MEYRFAVVVGVAPRAGSASGLAVYHRSPGEESNPYEIAAQDFFSAWTSLPTAAWASPYSIRVFSL
jgi:hypothetical protein